MPTCPHCGATVPEGAVYCGNCGASLSSATTPVSATQPQVTSQGSSAWSAATATPSDTEMQARLQKALKRSEQLGYAVAGLGIAIIVVYLLLYLILPFA